MNNAVKQEPWAPDDCPPDVVELINIENQMAALGLRGLASADSKQVRRAWHRLTAELRGSYRRGYRKGLALGATSGLCVAVLVTLALRLLAGL